jgi:hypothetical protein
MAVAHNACPVEYQFLDNTRHERTWIITDGEPGDPRV